MTPTPDAFRQKLEAGRALVAEQLRHLAAESQASRSRTATRGCASRCCPIASFAGGSMANVEDEVWVQLATRIPKPLHRELKLHCVQADESVMGFVVAALEEKLAKVGRRRAGRRP